MAMAVKDQGLAGDHAGGGRQITILDERAWQAACKQLNANLDAGARRANLLLEGLDLRHSRGQKLTIGDVAIEILGETRPCELLNDTHEGLMQALRPDWRGGVFGKILVGGEIRVGDTVESST